MKLKKIAILMMAGMMAGSCVGCTLKEPVSQMQSETQIYKFKFEIDGKTYKIPSKISDFIKNGWELQNENIPDVESGQITNCQLVKGKKTIAVNMVNRSEKKKKYTDCRIGGVQVNYTGTDDTKVILSKGLSVTSKLTEKEITEKWEKSTDKTESEFGTTIRYAKGPNIGYVFEFNKEEKLSSFRIENWNFSETDKEATTEEIKKMNAYDEPKSLTDNAFDYIMKLEGNVMKLPVPVSVLLDKGWEIAEAPDDIAGKTDLTGGLIMKKGEKEVTFTVSNTTDGTVTCRDAIVTEVFMNAYLDSNIEFELSSGIKLGITEDELKEKVDLSIFKATTDQNNITSYVFSEANRFMSFDIRDGKLFNMCIKNK